MAKSQSMDCDLLGLDILHYIGCSRVVDGVKIEYGVVI